MLVAVAVQIASPRFLAQPIGLAAARLQTGIALEIRVAETLGITAGVAGRYASALFELAQQQNALDDVRRDLSALTAALAESADLRRALTDPLIKRADMVNAVDALAGQIDAGPLSRNFVKLMAAKRRLPVLPRAIAAFEQMVADARGEVAVEVRSATALTEAQADELRTNIASATGRTIQLNSVVDPELIGGLIVKIGSRMIDASLRSKLATLRHRMREVG